PPSCGYGRGGHNVPSRVHTLSTKKGVDTVSTVDRVVHTEWTSIYAGQSKKVHKKWHVWTYACFCPHSGTLCPLVVSTPCPLAHHCWSSCVVAYPLAHHCWSSCVFAMSRLMR